MTPQADMQQSKILDGTDPEPLPEGIGLTAFLSLANASQDYVSLIDRGYVYRFVNTSYLDALGTTREAILGRTVADIWGEETFQSLLKSTLDACFQGTPQQTTNTYAFHLADESSFEATYTPITEQGGGEIRFALTRTRRAAGSLPAGLTAKGLDEQCAYLQEAYADLSRLAEERTRELSRSNERLRSEIQERTRVESSLRHAQERFSLAAEAGKVGVWEYDFFERTIQDHENLARLLGYEPHETSPDIDFWAALCHADDLPYLLELAQGYRMATMPEFSLEHRMLARGGGIRWFATQGFLVRDASGESTERMVGASIDITTRKAAEERLQRSETRYRSIIENTPVGICITNARGEFEYVNGAYTNIYQGSSEDFIGRPVTEIVSKERRGELERLHQEYILGKRTVDREWTVRTLKGEPRHIIAESVRIIDLDETPKLITFLLDITQRKEMERDLLTAMSKAEAASRAKSEFLAAMSHEIRTPMNAIIGMTELTLGTELEPDQADSLNTVKDAATHLLSILNDILDFSKIEAGRVELEQVPFVLSDTLDAVLKSLAPQAEAKGIRLTLETDPALPASFVGDAHRLRQILYNLLGNALKFTEEGSVTLRLEPLDRSGRDPRQTGVKPKARAAYQAAVAKARERERNLAAQFIMEDGEAPEVVLGELHPETLLVTVQDTGIGIPEDRQESIFESFSQADGSTSRKYGGTGLGLAITRQLVLLAGGAVWLESTVGRGSTFRFTLTLPATDHHVGNTTGAGSVSPASALPHRALQVLLVEDTPVNAKVTGTFLHRLGHTTRLVTDGAGALRELAAHRFDLVLMDIEMPGMDGLEATRRIRAGEAGEKARRVPIIALTAHAFSEMRAAALEAGMDDYVTKPLDFYDLAIRIERFGGQEVHGRGSAPDDTPPRQAANDSDAPSVLDRGSALRRLGGDAFLYREVAAMFARDLPNRMVWLREAHRHEHLETLARLAQTLAAMAGTVGAGRIHELALRLQETAREGLAQAAANQLEKLLEEMEAVRPLLAEITTDSAGNVPERR